MDSPPVRILHIITRLIVGGAQENTLYTVLGQRKHPGYRVTLLAGIDEGQEGNLHAAARDERVDLVLVPWLVRPIRPMADLYALFRLYRLIRRGYYDIVHTHSSKAGILGRLAARLAGVPIVVHTLHSLVFHKYQEPWKNRLYIWLKRACAPLTDVFISVNAKTSQGAIAAGIGEAAKHVTIYSGMPLDPFLAVATELSVETAKHRLGIPPQAPVVGKIARLTLLKGHDQFFDAAAIIAARAGNAWFLVVGDGELRDACVRRARDLGILHRTVFTGLVQPEQIPGCIQAMDVLVHASLREGIARVIPQAGAMGKPVVVFDLDGAPEVVEDGKSGYLVPALDTQLMAERVLELLADPDRRRTLGEAARDIVLSNFSAERMVSRINGVYEDLLRQRRTPRRPGSRHPWRPADSGTATAI